MKPMIYKLETGEYEDEGENAVDLRPGRKTCVDCGRRAARWHIHCSGNTILSFCDSCVHVYDTQPPS